MADTRYKNGVWQGNRVSPMQALYVQANDPIQSGWHWSKEANRFELNHCGLTAWMRRANNEEAARLGLTGFPWIIGLIGDDAPYFAYNGLVSQFTAEVKRDLYRAALEMPVEANDYRIERRTL